MLKFSQVSTALRVSSRSFSGLTAGVSLVAISRTFIREDQRFILVESDFDSDFQESVISHWAICRSSQVISDRYDNDSEYLSRITHLSSEEVQCLFNENANFLLFLQVYMVPIESRQSLKFNRQFAALASPITVVDEFPVISNKFFGLRKCQIESRTPPKHPTLESLQGEIAQYAQINLEGKAFEKDLKIFLGWAEPDALAANASDWIKGITTSGNSSDGPLFEKRVRQSFIHLGFRNTLGDIKASLDPDATGGAGGIDIYCEHPFPIVGECKASKYESVPNSVSAQLIHLGNTHLGKEQFEASIKIIFAAGNLTTHAEKAAVENQMNVMRPETLQRLVELKTAHPGAIDLLELKPCLESAPFGTDADAKVNQFIDGVWQRIKVRSHIVSKLKTSLEISQESKTGIERFYGYFCGSNPPQPLADRELYNILIELSSPLAGHLGRTKGSTWKDDRFYFLRDLIVE
jgi:hypothetical protein